MSLHTHKLRNSNQTIISKEMQLTLKLLKDKLSSISTNDRGVMSGIVSIK